jgi:hypothetical protein
MIRIRPVRFLASLAIVGLLGTASGCAASATGPLHTAMVGGLPAFGVTWSLAHPGQSDAMTAFIVNDGPGSVTLVSASLIPISGHPVGRLIHLAISHDGTAGARGWPPGVPITPFTGAQIPVGQSNVIFGVEGPVAGRAYMAAGLNVVYRYRGRLYTTTAWSAATDCAENVVTNTEYIRCRDLSEIARHATEKLAGL